jgi:N-acetylated-alpha-linked acidic dipeptidase
LQHLGIPTLDFGFGGEDGGGEYHSIYDSYDDYTRFKDPNFAYGVALAQTTGHSVLRMADADVLPFDFRSLQVTISKYAEELSKLADDTREATTINNQLIKSNQYTLAADPTVQYKAPEAKAEVPAIDFKPLTNSLDSLKKSADKLATYWSAAILKEGDHDKLNKLLYQAEQQLLATDGLPRRGWYKHTIYAPGFYTGYGVKTIPGVREAIEQHNWEEVKQQIGVVAGRINALAGYLAMGVR